MSDTKEVGFYAESGHYLATVKFRHKWQAYLFHLLLNSSKSHNGTRGY